MKIFISQPLRGRSEEEIKTERNAIMQKVRERYPDAVEIQTFFQNSGDSPLVLLGKSLELLATADLAVFTGNWFDARGCYVERLCCEEYGIPYEVVE